MNVQAEGYSKKDLHLFRKINLVFRFTYTIPFILASVCGIVYAACLYDVPWYICLTVPSMVLLLAMLVNFTNDYYDHLSGIDLHVRARMYDEQSPLLSSEALKKIYWEGNQFDTGLVSEKQGRLIIAALISAILLLSIPVILYRGTDIIILGAVGLFFAIFYTAPPINLGARGLGEISVAFSFFMMSFGSFFAATGTWNWEIVIFSVMLGAVVGLMRLGDSLSTHEAHIAFGERSLSVRLGVERTVPLFKGVIAAAYVCVAAMMYFDLLYGLLFLTLPLSARLWKIITARSGRWELAMMPFMLLLCITTELFFITAVLLSASFGPVTFW